MLASPAHMHIPDGYLSPLTSLVMALLVLPFWVIGARRLRKRSHARHVPLIALMAAFSFIVMMFNVPLPGGTSGHAVGGALAAIFLGPEVASIAISVALVIQAIFFGDGGILQIGANCFNMAVVLPYVSYAVYRLVTANAPITSRRRVAGAALGGWVGLSVSAFFAAVEFGVQPLLFHAADGTPLYAPYPLSVSIPAMVIPHLLLASVIEGALAAMVVLYLQRAHHSLLEAPLDASVTPEATGQINFGRLRLAWVGLSVLIIATPLGLLAPGTAWGEWGARELGNMGLGFVPHGLIQLENLWGAPMAGYDLPGLGNASLGYVLSGAVGVFLVAVIAWLFSKLLSTGERAQAAAQNAAQITPQHASEEPHGRAAQN